MCASHLVIIVSSSFQAKKFVESLPQNVKEKVSKEEADEMKKVLEAVGGTVEIEVWNTVQLTKFGIKIYVVPTHVPFLLMLLIIKKKTLLCSPRADLDWRCPTLLWKHCGLVCLALNQAVQIWQAKFSNSKKMNAVEFWC